MDIMQILLALPTYPDRVPDSTLESACRLAELLRANMTVRVSQLDGDQGTWPPVIGAFPLNFPGMMQELVTQSEINAAASCVAVERLCTEYEINLDLRRALMTLYASPCDLIDLSRLHDLLILPVPEIESFDRSYVEPVIFQSGRPTLLLPSSGKQLQSLDRVVLAWDYSREATRALADSLPILRLATDVHVLTAFGEKHIETSCVAGDLEKYLTKHQIRYSLHQVAAGVEPIADILLHYAKEINAGMLIMGAYGHSRVREFVLGGASRGVLSRPALPILLSH